MFRVLAIAIMVMSPAMNGLAADLVSMTLCASKDYDAAVKNCAAGKSLQGDGVTIDPRVVGGLDFLTMVQVPEDTEIYHVWIMETKSSGKVLFYDASSRMLREAYKVELDWLKQRKIEGVRVLVKMTASASESFRLRSRKTLTPAMSGSWKVQIYDGSNLSPLGEMKFTVSTADHGITN